MPKKILPSAELMESFMEILRSTYSCIPVEKQEVLEWIAQIPKDEPLSHYKQTQQGIELCFKYVPQPNPASLQVIAWTTYVAGVKSVREHDAAWVIIMDVNKRKPLLYSFPIHRTKNFLKTFEKYIAAFISLVNHWPQPCARCGSALTLKQVPGVLLGKTFACPNKHRVRGWIYQNLPEVHRTFLESRYREYAKYREKLDASGKSAIPRVLIRAKVASPQSKSPQSKEENYSQLNPLTDDFPYNDLQYEEE